MADNSGNFVSKFVPQSYFFTDPAAITQTADQAFGPVSEDEYRVTAKFSLSAESMAYAICTGIAFIQPQTGNADRVNLILRPFKQPIQGFDIKYFIYRGLKKSDFFDSNGAVLQQASNTSDFINQVNQDFADYYGFAFPADPISTFLARYIGFDPTNQNDSALIDDYFFKQAVVAEDGSETANLDFELPLIQAGATLANFAAGECGMDVVISWGDYKLPQPNDEFVFDLAYARAAEKMINVAAETDAFKKKQIREQIYQFLDPAAYFGFHANEGGLVKLNNGNDESVKKGEQIYTDLLSNFHTKNNIYLYIQSDRTRSYNFYGNYNINDDDTNSLKLGVTEASLTERTYEELGWPLIIDASAQAHGETSNKLYLQLVTDNNANTILYGQIAVIDNAQSNNFCGPDDLRTSDDQSSISFSKTVILSNPAATSGNNKLNIATFCIIIYHGCTYNYVSGEEVDDTGATVNMLNTPNFFDDVFGNITVSSVLKNNENSDYSELRFAKPDIINHFFNQVQHGVSAVEWALINDTIDTGLSDLPQLRRITYSTQNIDVLTDATSVTKALTNSTIAPSSQSKAINSDKTYSLPDPFYYDLLPFTDDGQVINGVQISSKDDTVPNKIVLGLTASENDSIKNLMTGDLQNPRLFLIDLFENGNDLISPEGVSYQKYKVAVIAEKDGVLKMYAPTEDVLIYSTDRNYHFSAGYSKYMPSLAYTSPYIIVNPTL